MDADKNFFLTVILAALLAWPCVAQNVAVALVDAKEVRKRLEGGVVFASKRQGAIRALFGNVGCAVEEQPIDKHSANVICTLPGETAEQIIVGAHYDFIDRGRGIVDDWSGTSLLPSLYEALKSRSRHHTYVFVAFAEEERGLYGSSLYVKKLTAEQRSRIKAFVNLECLGLTSTKVWVSRSSPFLVDRLVEMARVMNLELQGVNVEQIGDDDTHPFQAAKIPVVSIHSVTQAGLPILHSSRDNEAAIQFDDYYASYKLISFYLGFLDVKV